MAYLAEGAWILLKPLMGYRTPDEVKMKVV
jgi:hypothetical protein